MIATTVDRYLAKRIARPFVGVVAIVVMLLSLENSARLIKQLGSILNPWEVLLRLTVYLLPEYLGSALFLAVYLGTALALRGLALSGEFDIFSAIGLSPLRLLRAPLVIACLSAVLFLVTRGYLEPWGERQLDTFGTAVRVGELGVKVEAGEFYSPTQDITFFAEKVDRKTGNLLDVVVETPDAALFAKRARAQNGGAVGIMLILENGQIVRTNRDKKMDVVAFQHVYLPLPSAPFPKQNARPRQLNARRSIGELSALAAVTGSSNIGLAARAGLSARVVSALLIVLLPFLALAVAIPPKRQSGALGIGMGFGTIIAFIQIVGAIEDAAKPTAPVQLLLLLLVMATSIFLAVRLHNVKGAGYLETRFQASLSALRNTASSLSRLINNCAGIAVRRRLHPMSNFLVSDRSMNEFAITIAQPLPRRKSTNRGLPWWWKFLNFACRNGH